MPITTELRHAKARRLAMAALLCLGSVLPTALIAQQGAQLGLYGTPGHLDMPSADTPEDGELSFHSSYFGGISRNTLSFQITPRIGGSFRYSKLDDYGIPPAPPDRFDRSFDLRFLLVEETRTRPAISLGLQDFGGTGTFGAEYLVATKQLSPRLRGSVGMGWGRFASYGGFDNPLSIFGDGFRKRPEGPGSITEVGRVEFGRWFRGDAALFAGLTWQINDRLSFAAEYSSDAYSEETARGLFSHRAPVNLGLSYRFDNGMNLGAHFLHGSEIGISLGYAFNPKHPPFPGGTEGAPLPVYAADGQAAADSWALPATGPGLTRTPEGRAQALLAQDGLALVALQIEGDHAILHFRNDRFDAQTQALGRAARALTHALPPRVTGFTLVPVAQGRAMSAVTVRRRDLETLEHSFDGAWQSYVRARIEDGAAYPRPQAHRPRLSYRLNPYIAPSFFDPDSPVRADIGAELNLAYTPAPGLIVSARLRQPLIGNLDAATRASNSILPHVRSDHVLYETQSDLELPHLTAEYFFRPGTNLYGRVTAGYLEKMYGGLSAELLWKPVTGPWALGAELNYVRQRDYDQLLGFRDYDTVTGHLSAYYDFDNGFLGQIDAGRYLAGDWGATFAIDREFGNGIRIGAFFTLTDVPFDDFGEGSFDKGIRITIPAAVLTGKPSRDSIATTIRPVTRDGGARLDVRNRLYDVTREFHDPALRRRWGRFWR